MVVLLLFLVIGAVAALDVVVAAIDVFVIDVS